MRGETGGWGGGGVMFNCSTAFWRGSSELPGWLVSALPAGRGQFYKLYFSALHREATVA